MGLCTIQFGLYEVLGTFELLAFLLSVIVYRGRKSPGRKMAHLFVEQDLDSTESTPFAPMYLAV